MLTQTRRQLITVYSPLRAQGRTQPHQKSLQVERRPQGYGDDSNISSSTLLSYYLPAGGPSPVQ